jgi:hypothetical protein
LSPDDAKMVTPIAARSIASVLNVCTIDVLSNCSTAPHEMEFDLGGLLSPASVVIHRTKGSYVVPATHQKIDVVTCDTPMIYWMSKLPSSQLFEAVAVVGHDVVAWLPIDSAACTYNWK